MREHDTEVAVKGDVEIYFDNPADLGSLRRLLSDHASFTVSSRTLPTRPGELSAGREILELVFGTGGGGAAFGLVKAWIESKVATIKIKVDEHEEAIEVRSRHAAADVERVKAALRAKRGDDTEL